MGKITSILALGFTAALLAGCETKTGEQPANPLQPGVVDPAVIANPPAVTRSVGQGFEIFATIYHWPVKPNLAWSATPGILTIVEVLAPDLVYVRCLSAGRGTVTVSADVAGLIIDKDDATVTCVDPTPAPPPPPPPNFVQVTPTSIFFEHIVGRTACPQRITPIEIKNTSGRALQVTVRAESAAIDVGVEEEAMQPGGVQMLEPTFNCRTVPPIRTTIVITVNVDGTAQLYRVDVTGNPGQ